MARGRRHNNIISYGRVRTGDVTTESSRTRTREGVAVGRGVYGGVNIVSAAALLS